MLWPVTVQPYGFVAISALLRFYLLCSPSYNTILLVHDSSRNPHTNTTGVTTDDLVDYLRTTLSHTDADVPLSACLTINIANALHVPQHSTLEDPRALVVWLLDDAQHIADHFQMLHGPLGGGAVHLNARCDNIIIAPQQMASHVPPHEMQRLLHYVARRRIVNIALVTVSTLTTPSTCDTDLQTPQIQKLHYDRLEAIPYEAAGFCAGHIFYDKTLDWRTDGIKLLLFMDFDPPGVINLTRSIGDGRAESNIGGPFAYFASLLDAHLGTTSRMFAVKESDEYRNVQPQLARYLDEFEARAYREDGQQPHWLPYDLLEPHDYDGYTRNTTVLSFEPRTFEPPGTHSLYPFGTVNYVLCVPNCQHNRSVWWSALWRFPLVRIWALAIGVVTLARVALRWLQRDALKRRPAVDMLFEICGVAFGGDVSSAAARLDNRAERVLLLFVSLFAMLASILCSGLLFQKFASRLVLPDINSLDQLGEHSYLDVWMPTEFADETEDWLDRRIPNRIVREDSDVIESMIYARNTSAAYIVAETKVNILLNRIEMLDALGNNVFHEVHYTIIQKPKRFVAPEWFMVQRLSQLQQQAIEHGLMKYFVTRTHNMLRFWRSGLQQRNTGGIDVMPMAELQFEFVIVGVGMLAGLVAFAVELVWRRRCWRLWPQKWMPILLGRYL